MQVASRKKEYARRYILAAVGGYVDAVSFLMLGGFFVNQVTGDVILGADSLARGGSARSWVQLGIAPLFFVAVAVAAAAAMAMTPDTGRGSERGDLKMARTLLLAESALLAVFAVLGIAFHSRPGPTGALVIAYIGGTGVSAMACQAALSRLVRYPESTTVMTTNTIQIAIDSARLLLGGPRLPDRQMVRQQATELGTVVVSFFAGAVAGAALADHFQFWSILIPVATVGALGLQAQFQLRR